MEKVLLHRYGLNPRSPIVKCFIDAHYSTNGDVMKSQICLYSGIISIAIMSIEILGTFRGRYF